MMTTRARATPRRVATVAALAALLLAWVRPATAGEKVHTVSSGDSASSIAAKYYGDVELGDFLLRYNGKGGTVIHAGEKLRIPYCDVHKVGKGDTWSSLSTKHLEKTQAYPAIASLNGFAAGAVLPAGGQIVIPVVLSWKLESGDSLASLAGRWYGDPNRADLLQLFNDVDDPKRLSVGETVQVPLASIRLRKSAAAELPQKKPAPVRLAAHSQEPAVAKAPASAASDTGKAPAKAAIVSKTPAPAQTSAGDPKKAAPAASDTGKAPAKAATVSKTPAPAQTSAADPKKAAPVKTSANDKAPVKTGVADKPSDKAPATTPVPQTLAAPPAPPAPSKAVDVPMPEPTVASATPRFGKEIDAATKAFAEGHYASARQLLESLRERSRTDGTDAERVEIMRLLAFVYVAFDMRTEACIAYNSLPLASGSQTLDPDVVSPRIRDALSRCPGGKV